MGVYSPRWGWGCGAGAQCWGYHGQEQLRPDHHGLSCPLPRKAALLWFPEPLSLCHPDTNPLHPHSANTPPGKGAIRWTLGLILKEPHPGFLPGLCLPSIWSCGKPELNLVPSGHPKAGGCPPTPHPYTPGPTAHLADRKNEMRLVTWWPSRLPGFSTLLPVLTTQSS